MTGRRVLATLLVVGAILLTASLILAVISVWSAGSVAPRLGATAAILGGTGFMATLIGSVGLLP